MQGLGFVSALRVERVGPFRSSMPHALHGRAAVIQGSHERCHAASHDACAAYIESTHHRKFEFSAKPKSHGP